MGPVETLSRVAMSCGSSSFVLTCGKTPSSLWVSYTGIATGLTDLCPEGLESRPRVASIPGFRTGPSLDVE